jgi:hypothetical protein
MDIHESACQDEAPDCSHSTTNSTGIKSDTITGIGRSMSDLAISLSRYAERRVFNETGLDGRYDFRLAWSEEVSIFTALEEQLGLKLQSAKGPVDVVVTDSLERAMPDYHASGRTGTLNSDLAYVHCNFAPPSCTLRRRTCANRHRPIDCSDDWW